MDCFGLQTRILYILHQAVLKLNFYQDNRTIRAELQTIDIVCSEYIVMITSSSWLVHGVNVFCRVQGMMQRSAAP